MSVLVAEWKTPQPYDSLRGGSDWTTWRFQRPVRIAGFEFDEKPRGRLLSIVCGVEEQLIGGPVPLQALVQYYKRRKLELSPDAGWKVTALVLPTLRVGAVIQVMTEDFTGGFRPFGREAL